MAPPGYFYDDVSRNAGELLTYFWGVFNKYFLLPNPNPNAFRTQAWPAIFMMTSAKTLESNFCYLLIFWGYLINIFW